MSDTPNDEPYFIEIDQNGCPHCGAGRTWCVIRPDGVALGQAFGEEEDAAYLAESLNIAYHIGLTQRAVKP